jgi:hypothetical protein
MSFTPGQKVVCTDDTVSQDKLAERARNFRNWVVKDKEYTVREVLDNDNIAPALLLEELRNPVYYQPLIKKYQEAAFGAWRFAPLQVPPPKTESWADDILHEIIHEEELTV